MFEKNLEIGYLLDFYGDVLSERKRTVLDYYYNDDLSLAEIAEDEGISRQGIRHVVKKGEDQLMFLESKLGIAKQHEELVEINDALIRVITQLEESDAHAECVDALKKLSKNLLKGN